MTGGTVSLLDTRHVVPVVNGVGRAGEGMRVSVGRASVLGVSLCVRVVCGHLASPSRARSRFGRRVTVHSLVSLFAEFAAAVVSWIAVVARGVLRD